MLKSMILSFVNSKDLSVGDQLFEIENFAHFVFRIDIKMFHFSFLASVIRFAKRYRSLSFL